MPDDGGDFFGRDRIDQTVSDLHKTSKEMRELHPGPRQCLRCDRWFYSWDMVLNRRCERCKEADEYEQVFLEDLPEEDELDTSLMDGEE